MLYLYKGYNKRKRKTTFLFCAPVLSSQKAQDSYYKMHKTISPKITKGTECIFSFLKQSEILYSIKALFTDNDNQRNILKTLNIQLYTIHFLQC